MGSASHEAEVETDNSSYALGRTNGELLIVFNRFDKPNFICYSIGALKGKSSFNAYTSESGIV